MVLFLQIVNITRIVTSIIWLFTGVFQPSMQAVSYAQAAGTVPFTFIGGIALNGIGATILLFLHKIFPAVWSWLLKHPELLEYLGIVKPNEPTDTTDTERTLEQLLAELSALLEANAAKKQEDQAKDAKLAATLQAFYEKCPQAVPAVKAPASVV